MMQLTCLQLLFPSPSFFTIFIFYFLQNIEPKTLATNAGVMNVPAFINASNLPN